MAIGQYLKIVDSKDRVHILPDNKHNREFHQRYTTGAPAGDKYKSLNVVKGEYTVDKDTGAQEFEEKETISALYENLTPSDSKAAAIENENESLRAQIEALQIALQKKTKGKGKEGGEGE